MNNIKDLIKALKSEEFLKATEKAYDFLTADKEEPKVSLDEFTLALRGLFVDQYITAKDAAEMNSIIQAAKNSYVYAVDANGIFKTVETAKSRPGEVVEIDYFKQMIDIIEYKNEPMYDDLTKCNDLIANIIKKEHSFYSIKQIKMGNYRGPGNYRISQKEIRTIENVKMIGPVNKIIHDLYDVEGVFGPYCEYEDIPQDSILKQFALHTDKNNPLFKIVFEDGTIVEYLEGDLRVLSYKFKDLLILTKLYVVQELQQNGIFDMSYVDDQKFFQEIIMSSNRAKGILNTLEEVYTKRMIDSSKKEIEGIKELVKEYNL